MGNAPAHQSMQIFVNRNLVLHVAGGMWPRRFSADFRIYPTSVLSVSERRISQGRGLVECAGSKLVCNLRRSF